MQAFVLDDYMDVVTDYARVCFKKANRKRAGFEWEDIIQEGVLYFYKAVNTFDPVKGEFLPYLKKVLMRNFHTLVHKSYLHIHASVEALVEVGIHPSISITPLKFLEITSSCARLATKDLSKLLKLTDGEILEKKEERLLSKALTNALV